MNKTTKRQCKRCGKGYERPVGFPPTSFCGLKCASAFRGENLRGKNSPRWKHGMTHNGYRRASGKERRLEHRVIMEKILGRKLETNEWVHHINGDKLDNRPQNLILVLPETHFSDITCPNCSYHFLIK